MPKDVDGLLRMVALADTDEEKRIAANRRFYDGYQGVELTDRQEQYLGKPEVEGIHPDSFTNVSKKVVTEIVNRLGLVGGGKGIGLPEDASGAAQDALTRVVSWWRTVGMDALQSDLHRRVMRDGRAAMFVGWDVNTGLPDISVADVYAPDTSGDYSDVVRFFPPPGEVGEYSPEFAIRTFQMLSQEDDFNRYWRADVYVPGEIYRYKSEANVGKIDAHSNWTLLTPEEVAQEVSDVTANPQILPFDDLPIVLFFNAPLESELQDVRVLQKLINKTLGDIDIAADFHGTPMFTADEFTPEYDTNGEKIDQELWPGEIIVAPGAKRVEPANLSGMWDGGILRYLDLVALVKGFPMWLLNPDRAANLPSGRALIVSERSLIAAVQTKQAVLSPSWSKVFNLALAWANHFEAKKLPQTDFTIVWKNPATSEELVDTHQKVQTGNEAGLPKEWLWRNVLGLSDSGVAKVKEMMQAEISAGLSEFIDGVQQ